MIFTKEYKQKRKVKTGARNSVYRDDTHHQSELVYEIWFLFILIYRSRKWLSCSM